MRQRDEGALQHRVLAGQQPPGSPELVTATDANQMAIIDEDTGTVLGRGPTGDYPDGLAYDPQHRTVWTTNESGGSETILDALPEICTANRYHRRFLRQHDIATLDAAFARAQQLIHDWLQGGDERGLHQRWRHRLDALRHDPYADPYRPSQHRIELATYPEAVTLTGLLMSAHWRNHPRLHDEAERRLHRAQDA